MYYPVRHPVVQTSAVQLRMKERVSSIASDASAAIHNDDATDMEHDQQENDVLQKPDWVVCNHASPAMFNYGMPEIQPVPTEENHAARGDRDRMTYPIPARDDRCIALELKRPQARCLFSKRQVHQFKTDHPNTVPQLPMTLHVRFVEQIKDMPEVIRSVFASITSQSHLANVLRDFFPKVHARILELLSHEETDGTTLMHDCLMGIAKKLPCRNSNIVMFNPALTSLTGSNTAAYFLGMLEQARGALFYLVKYLTKDKTELSASLVVLLDARKHIDKYPSVADNTGTEIRTTQHFLVRVLNSLGGMSEYGAPQAASVVMERPCTWVSHQFTYVFPHEILHWLAQRSEDSDMSRNTTTASAPIPAQIRHIDHEMAEPVNGLHTTSHQEPLIDTQHSSIPQRSTRGLILDTGTDAWLNLEQVASIIQLHNVNNKVVTTLLQGVSSTRWGTVWAHMRDAENAADDDIEHQIPRRRDAMTRYGELLFTHKRNGISGIYPMNKPGHWRVMIVSHILMHVTLLDPMGDDFSTEEIDSVKYAYSGYRISTYKNCVQTDGWNCGVWVAWIASFWTLHVENGFEGTMSIDDVIEAGLTAENIVDINTDHRGWFHNEAKILQVRKLFRGMIYAEQLPKHLTDWLDVWNTPLRDVQYVSEVTSLGHVHRTPGISSTEHVDLTEDAEDLLNTDLLFPIQEVSTSTTSPAHMNLTDHAREEYGTGHSDTVHDDRLPFLDGDAFQDETNAVLLEAIIHDGPCGSAVVYQVDGKAVPVSPGIHYLLRSPLLYMMTLAEFNLCTQVVLKKEPKEGDTQNAQQNTQNTQRTAGRPDNLRMCFASEDHPLYHSHDIQLRSKINPWILGGDPPPKPPPLPRPDNPPDVWTKTANTFAAYYLVLFRPFSEEDIGTMAFTWDALCSFMQQIDPVCQINDHTIIGTKTY